MGKYKARLLKQAKVIGGAVSGMLVMGVLTNFIGVWSIVPGLASGYVVYRYLPDSSVETVKKELEDLPSRKKIEQRLQQVDSTDPEVNAEAISFVNPDDSADALSILEPNASDLTIDQLNQLAYIISAGIQLPGDAQEVLAQLERMETTKDSVNLVYNGLFKLYDAAQLGRSGEMRKKTKIGAIKKASKNRGAIAAGLSLIGVNAGQAAQSVEGLEGLEDEELVGKDVTARMLAMSTAETFSRLVAPPREYHTQLTSIINDDDERADTRGSAAVVLGGIGREHSDLSERITEEIRPLISDESRGCRLLAVEALAGPALHHEGATDVLKAIVKGEKREFALDNALQEKAKAILSGEDTYSYQPSDNSQQNTGEPDEDDDLSI